MLSELITMLVEIRMQLLHQIHPSLPVKRRGDQAVHIIIDLIVIVTDDEPERDLKSQSREARAGWRNSRNRVPRQQHRPLWKGQASLEKVCGVRNQDRGKVYCICRGFAHAADVFVRQESDADTSVDGKAAGGTTEQLSNA
jgi:hypothetical protein